MAFSKYPGFCGGSYPQTAARMVLSVEDSINCYPHRNEARSGKNERGLLIRPGNILFGTPATSGVGRALWAGEERLFSVAGTKLNEWSSGGVETVLGDIGSGSSPCTIVSNTTQLMVINPNTGVVYVSAGLAVIAVADSGGLVEVQFNGGAPATGTTVVFAGTDAGLGINGSQTVTNTGASTVTVDGSTWPGGSPTTTGTGSYFITPTIPMAARMGFQLGGRGYLVGADTNTVFQSDTQTATGFQTWDPLEQATLITAQDRIVAAIADYDGAWLIGSATSQYLGIAGVPGFNLAPDRGAFVQIGTCAPYSVATVTQGICMVSGSRRGYGQIVLLRPGSFKRLSNYAVEQSLRTVTDWGTVTGVGYSWEGHDFYELDVPDLNLTWVYDFTENEWHKRRGWNGSAYTKMLGRMTVCTFNNTYYAISAADGKIYKQSDVVGTDAGVTFRCQRTGPLLANGQLTNFNLFRIDMQYGDGSSTVGANARFSLDGGLSFGAYSYEIMGRNGEANVLEWPMQGTATIRGFVADVYWDQGVFAVSSASVDVTPGLE